MYIIFEASILSASFQCVDHKYQYLDQPDFRDRFVSFRGGVATSRFYIEGLRCSKCVAKVESQATALRGLYSVRADISQNRLVVDFSPETLALSELTSHFNNLGFDLTPLRVEQQTKNLLREDRKKQVMRLGVAGFLAGQIMMLSFSVYFGLAGELKKYFEWAQFFLYLPIVTYVAWPFYKGFWQGLKAKSLSIDGPMSIASLLGFSISTYHLMVAKGHIYFDSTAGFLFLILGTRLFHQSTREKYLSHLKPISLLEDQKVERQNQTKDFEWTTADRLEVGDYIRLHRGDISPVDGVLCDSVARFDFALLNGESRIKNCTQDQTVSAGAKLHSDLTILRVKKLTTDTLLGHVLARLEGEENKNQSTNASDRVAQILLAVVLSVGGIFMLMSLFLENADYFERGFSLIILACPCALAFGAPLAKAVALRQAKKRGFILKSDSIFERLQQVTHIFFDKTGTLTTPQIQVDIKSSKIEMSELKSILLSLESRSQHPIAEGLRHLWGSDNLKLLTVKNYREDPKAGVYGDINDEMYFFGRNSKTKEKCFGLWKKNQLLSEIEIRFEVLHDMKETISLLKSKGLQVGLISGDIQQSTQDVAKQLHIPLENTFYEVSALQKAQIIANHKNAMMIGDGFNDSVALRQAYVSLAVRGSVENALHKSDIFMIHGDLKKLPELFLMAGFAGDQMKNNIKSALIYNSLGAALALSGFANPFVAALLMPASSVFILLSTIWSERKWKFS